MAPFKYEIIIYWSENDLSYIAEVPELADCMSDGKTYSEALENAEQIIAEWIRYSYNATKPKRTHHLFGQ
ncbi:type II toxin-antitoxin system HicB family antitoxin [Sphingobacteriales bacterium UPWRP_1]|nr:hypothetical protein BVG80_10530 [Sphingobacteriales bacterium TSM_CSM]PSJ78852.1 type II toxin-antitoxin system HicB family antitoxin [Sphingobacteriales bacterium UPWRP_1]